MSDIIPPASCGALTSRAIHVLDVPVGVVESDIRAIEERQRLAAGVAAEARHIADGSDTAFAQLAVTHPDACSTAADYPGWDDALAAMVAKNKSAGGAA